MKNTKRSAAEKIADLTGCDIDEVRDGRYKANTFSNPSLFTVGDDYYACGNNQPQHEVGQPWQRKVTFRGDIVWESLMAVNA